MSTTEIRFAILISYNQLIIAIVEMTLLMLMGVIVVGVKMGKRGMEMLWHIR